MPRLSPLLEVQDLDLSCDRLSARRRDLPERAALVQSHAQAVSLDEAHASLLERREALARSEHDLEGEVTAVAAKAKEVEDNLYSGKVTVAKELEGLQEEIRVLRVKQGGLEEREMELLEEIDTVEGEMAENRGARSRSDVETGEFEAAIRKAEGEIDAEVARLSEQRGGVREGIAPAILAEYDRLRGKERLAGRAAAALADGSCGGCRERLPVLEYTRMKAEPADALLCCGRCGRVLVR